MSTFRQPSMFCWICGRFNRFEWTSTFCLVCKCFKSAAASSNFSGSTEGYLSWTSTSGSSLWDTFPHDRSYGLPKARPRPTGWSESLAWMVLYICNTFKIGAYMHLKHACSYKIHGHILYCRYAHVFQDILKCFKIFKVYIVDVHICAYTAKISNIPRDIKFAPL